MKISGNIDGNRLLLLAVLCFNLVQVAYSAISFKAANNFASAGQRNYFILTPNITDKKNISVCFFGVGIDSSARYRSLGRPNVSVVTTCDDNKTTVKKFSSSGTVMARFSLDGVGTDGYLPLPYEALGRSYLISSGATQYNLPPLSFVVIMNVEEDKSVTVLIQRPKQNNLDNEMTTKYVTIPPRSAEYVTEKDDLLDGMRLRGSGKFAVISGHVDSRLVAEMFPTVCTNAREFVIPYVFSHHKIVWTLIQANSDTDSIVDVAIGNLAKGGGSQIHLKKRNPYALRQQGVEFYNASASIQVVQAIVCCKIGGGIVKDFSSMTIIPSIDQWVTTAIVYPPEVTKEKPISHRMVVNIHKSQFADLKVESLVSGKDLKSAGDSKEFDNFRFVQFDLVYSKTEAVHVWHTKNSSFQVIQYGHTEDGDFVYAFPAAVNWNGCRHEEVGTITTPGTTTTATTTATSTTQPLVTKATTTTTTTLTTTTSASMTAAITTPTPATSTITTPAATTTKTPTNALTTTTAPTTPKSTTTKTATTTTTKLSTTAKAAKTIISSKTKITTTIKPYVTESGAVTPSSQTTGDTIHLEDDFIPDENWNPLVVIALVAGGFLLFVTPFLICLCVAYFARRSKPEEDSTTGSRSPDPHSTHRLSRSSSSSSVDSASAPVTTENSASTGKTLNSVNMDSNTDVAEKSQSLSDVIASAWEQHWTNKPRK